MYPKFPMKMNFWVIGEYDWILRTHSVSAIGVPYLEPWSRLRFVLAQAHVFSLFYFLTFRYENTPIQI